MFAAINQLMRIIGGEGWDCKLHPCSLPLRGQLRCPNSLPANLSNPRYAEAYNSFRVCPIQPLRHLSGQVILADILNVWRRALATSCTSSSAGKSNVSRPYSDILLKKVVLGMPANSAAPPVDNPPSSYSLTARCMRTIS